MTVTAQKTADAQAAHGSKSWTRVKDASWGGSAILAEACRLDMSELAQSGQVTPMKASATEGHLLLFLSGAERLP